MPNQLTADDIPQMLESSEFAALPHERRVEMTERALNDAAGEFAGRWDRETYRNWGRFASTVRERVSGMESVADAARHYGGVMLDAGRGMARMAIAGAADLGVTNPDGSLKAPAANIAEQAGLWTRKAADTANQWWAGGDKDLDEELGALKRDLDEGDFPLDDQEKLGAWMEEKAAKISEKQRFFYDRVEGSGKYPEAFPETNGLLNPDHAALVSRYLTTRDPGAWDQLVKGIKRTPGRVQLEREQAESVEKSPLVDFLSRSFDTEYGEAMQGAGDPLLLAISAVPLARGAVAAGTAASARTAGQVARGFGTSAAIGAGLGVAEAAVAEPNATWEDYKTAAKDMVAVALGFHGAGEGLGALARRALTRRQEAAAAEAGNRPTGEVPAEPSAEVPPVEVARPAARQARETVPAEAAPENPFSGPLENVPPSPAQGMLAAEVAAPTAPPAAAPVRAGRPMETPAELQGGLREVVPAEMAADVTRGLEVRRQEALTRAEGEGLPVDQVGALVETGFSQEGFVNVGGQRIRMRDEAGNLTREYRQATAEQIRAATREEGMFPERKLAVEEAWERSPEFQKAVERVDEGNLAAAEKLETDFRTKFEAEDAARSGEPAAAVVPGARPEAVPTEAALPANLQMPAVRGPLPSSYGGQLPPSTVQPWSGKVQTLHGIRRALLQAAGLPQAGLGRFAKALGIYKLKPETVRLQAINDIPVLAHEIGHAVHFRELSQQRGGPAETWGGRFDAELMPMGQPTSQPQYSPNMVRAEGVAEFTRLWLTDRAAARAQAPQFSAFWEQTLAQKNPRMAAQLNAAREMIADYVAMPAFEKAKAQVVFDAAAEKQPLSMKDRLRRSYAKWVNTIQPALDATREAGRMDPTLAARAKEVEVWMENHRGGWQSKAHADIFTHQTDLMGNRIGDGLAVILKDIGPGQGEAFSTYLALKRAAEIEGQGKRSGFENARLPAAEMKALEQRFEATRQKVLKWQENELRLLESSGLLDAQSAAAMRAANRDYVPFYRLYERLNNVSLGGKGADAAGYVDLSSGIRALKGSDRAILDPLQSMMKNALMFRKVAEQNHIGVQFFDLMSSLQGHGKWGERIKPKMAAKKVSHDAVVQKLLDEGVISNAAALPQHADLTLRLWEAVKKPDTKNGEVIVFKNGQRQHWEVKDPLLLEALKTADADALTLGKFLGPTMTKALTLPTKVLRFGATGGPWFAIPNWFRDQMIAGTFSKTGYVPFFDGVRGVIEALRKGDVYQRWVEAGGKFHGIQTGDMAYSALVQDVLPKDRSVRRMAAALANPRHWKEVLQYAGTLTEEATRVREFQRGIERGFSDREAANFSKVVTLNFARAGERGRVANMLIAFTNAKIQDLDMIVRNHLDPARRGEVMMKGLMYITAPSVLTWWLGKDDPVIQNLPEWRKNLFWNLNMGPVAKALGREEFVLSVPKPFLMGAIYGTSVEWALDYASGRDPNGVKKAFANLMNQGPDGLNPLEMAANIAGLRPALEVMTNWKFFQEQPVVPERTGYLPKEQQYDTFTSETAKLIGKGTGQSPMVIDHLIRGYFATAGKWGVDAIDWGMAKIGAVEVPPAPRRDLMESWILNRFAGSPYASNAWVDRFYKASQDMEGKLTVWNKQSDQMTTKDQADWWKKHGREIMHYQQTVDLQTGRTGAGDIRQAQAAMGEIGKAMKEVAASRTMTPDAKRAAMMELSKQRNERAEAAFKTLFPPDVRKRHY